MDVHEAIRTLRAVRKYEQRPVPEEVIQQIVEAGRLTASASNAQPWHFVIVVDRDALRDLANAAPTGPYLADAAFAIVVTIPHKTIAVSDASRAIQSMLLAAWAEGVGGNWVGFRSMEDAKSLLGIPDEMDILAILPFGYPADSGGRGKKQRKPLGEVASRGRYGTPYE